MSWKTSTRAATPPMAHRRGAHLEMTHGRGLDHKLAAHDVTTGGSGPCNELLQTRVAA